MSKHDDLIRKIQERAQADAAEAAQRLAASGLESNETLENAMMEESLLRCFGDLREEILADLADTGTGETSEEKKPWYKRLF